MTATLTAPDIGARNRDLDAMILAGRLVEAIDGFYHDDVEMQENLEAPTRGKAANRRREEEFVASIEQFHGARLLASAVNGDVSFSEWVIDATIRGTGRVVLNQVAARRWKDGQVLHERFYHA